MDASAEWNNGDDKGMMADDGMRRMTRTMGMRRMRQILRRLRRLRRLRSTI